MLQEKLNIGKMMPGFLLQDQQPNIEEVDQASVRKAMGHHVVWIVWEMPPGFVDSKATFLNVTINVSMHFR